MKPGKPLIITILVALMTISIFPIGCSSPVKKPAAPENTSFSDSPLNPTPVPIPRNPVIQISPKELVDQAVFDAGKIEGVKNAYAFVADKIIYVGLDLGEDQDGTQSTGIEKEVKQKIDSLKAGYTVRVTSDQNTVQLIKTVYQGLAEGHAFLDFNHEVHSVVLKMTPKGSSLFNLPFKFCYILGVN